MNDWSEYIVEDVAAPTRNALVGGPFGSNLVSKDYVESGVPVIRGQNMGLGKWVMGEFVFVSPEKARELAANIAKPGDLVFTQRGTLGQVAIVPDETYEQYIVSQSQMKLTVDPEKADAHFLYYYFSTSEQQEYIRQNSIQTGVPHTNLTILRNTPLYLPPLIEQRAIAEILGSLDDKIETNRRMNETLEATARTIFKSWFMDFDPVHYKSRGETPPGMDADTAALFPDSFDDTELGLIPAGWQVEPLSNHIIARKGLSYKGDGLTDVDGGIPMHNLNSVYEGGGYKYEGMKFYSGDYQERHIARAGDVIVTNTEQGHDLLLIGYPALVPNRYPTGLYSHHLYRVIPRKGSHITPRFIYFLLRTHSFHDVIGGYTNGTTVNMLPSDALERPLFVVPSPEIISRFDEIVVPILEKMEANHDTSERLVELRDMLLPKLVSGEIRVDEVEDVEELP